ncbi:MAG: peptidoglycan bridge formation glycyltransferase FemA/FemB family protein [Treponema sp.]|nr:peptidoglycan bridge formation glycyltransferase FemA/FemB family protein [Treponema sp.]
MKCISDEEFYHKFTMIRNENIPFIRSIKSADLAACDEADSFLQSAMWGRFKSRFGWQAKAFTVDWNEGGVESLLTLSRRIVPGFSMTYIPWGPELPAAFPDDPPLRAAAIAELARVLRPVLPRTTAFIRFDPPWFDAAGTMPPDLSAPFKRAAADIQPPDTVLIDLTPPPEDILAAMKPKWRYNIALAEKHGVTVIDSGEQGIDIFYRLLAETAERDGIAIHNIEYYRALFAECQDNSAAMPPRLHLYTAWHEGGALAAIVALFRGKQAVYLYGASANVKRNVMAPYALQWKAMRDAQQYGCTQYDLFGIPPDENPDHPMAGLYRFKTGFGGAIIHRPGSWDYPCKPALYALFNCAEHLRKKVRDRRKRRK